MALLKHLLSLILLYVTSNAKHTYKFRAYVSSQFWNDPDTHDHVYFRMCNSNWECGMFTREDRGWRDQGTSYYYDYVTNQYLGPIYYVQIVLEGSDQLCLGEIEVDGTTYDPSFVGNDCIDGGSVGCDVMTVEFSGGDGSWSKKESTPCEYANILDDTYKPTTSPTTEPTRSPTEYPTYPTNAPTDVPSQPTESPTNAPTMTPSVSPTSVTDSPTGAPFGSANVDMPASAPIAGAGATIIENEPGTDYGLILGIIFGILFCCILCLFLVYCYRRRKKQEDEVGKLNIQVAGGMDVGESIPDASPMSVGDGNPTTFTGHISQLSDIPQLPAETFPEGGESGTGTGTGTRGAGDGGGTGSSPASMDYDDDEEPVVPYASPDEADILHDDDEKDDMYEPALDIAAVHDHPNQVTAGGGDEYEYYYEDENGNIVPDSGYGNSPGGDQVDENVTNEMYDEPDVNTVGSMGMPPVVNDEESESENEQYEHAEMYNKKRSTANGKETPLNLDDNVSDNMYGL